MNIRKKQIEILLKLILSKDANFFEIKTELEKIQDVGDLELRILLYVCEKNTAIEADYYGEGKEGSFYYSVKYSASMLSSSNIEDLTNSIYKQVGSFVPKTDTVLEKNILKFLETGKKAFLEISKKNGGVPTSKIYLARNCGMSLVPRNFQDG